MQFKVGDLIQDTRWKSLKRIGIVKEVSEHEDGCVYLHAIFMDVALPDYQLRNVSSFAIFEAKDVTLLLPAETDPLFKFAEDTGLDIPEVSSEHTL